MTMSKNGSSALNLSYLDFFMSHFGIDDSGAFDKPDVGDPSALATRKARLNALAFEVHGSALQHGLRDVVECIDAYDRVLAFVDLAGDHRHAATASTDVKDRGGGAKGVMRNQGWLADRDDECGRRIGGPDAAVLDAESAATRASRDTGRLGLPIESEGEIAAMAATVNAHCCVLASGV